MQTINNLNPSILDEISWTFERFYSGNMVCYYSENDENVVPKYDTHFYDNLDSDLRVLSALLHTSGVDTFPGCQGSFLDRNNLKKQWNEIKSDERLIKKGGLEVCSFQTGEKSTFQKSKYQLPWNIFQDFEKEVSNKQKIGHLVISVPEKLNNISDKLKELGRFSRHTHIDFIKKTDDMKDLFYIVVKSTNEKQQKEEWIKLTNLFFMYLKGTNNEGHNSRQ